MSAERIQQERHYAVIPVDSSVASFATLRSKMEALRDDDQVRVVVLDVRQPGFEAEDDPAVLRDFVLPSIAAWAGEMNLSRVMAGLFCDIRIGESSQRLTWMPSMRGSGRARFADVLGVSEDDVMTALAEGMLQCGLVSRVVDGDPLEEAERLAQAIASRGPIATRFAKEAIWRGLTLPLEHALRYETDLTLLLQTTNDRAEGVEAFLNKRPPLFTGT